MAANPEDVYPQHDEDCSVPLWLYTRPLLNAGFQRLGLHFYEANGAFEEERCVVCGQVFPVNERIVCGLSRHCLYHVNCLGLFICNRMESFDQNPFSGQIQIQCRCLKSLFNPAVDYMIWREKQTWDYNDQVERQLHPPSLYNPSNPERNLYMSAAEAR
jgi:hypothetical protein